MTDFDFDELDKAVNGVLGVEDPAVGAPTPSLAQSAPSAQLSTQPAQVAQSAQSAQVTQPVQPAQLAQPAMPPAARRSSGRFMDMIHPSSDMRSSSLPGSNSGPNSGLSPASSLTVNPSASGDTSEPAASSSHGVETEPSSAPESPFLADAKVEKRPLGGAAFLDELTFEDLKPEKQPENPLDLSLGSALEPALEPAQDQDLLSASETSDKLPSPDEEALLAALDEETMIESSQPASQLDDGAVLEMLAAAHATTAANPADSDSADANLAVTDSAVAGSADTHLDTPDSAATNFTDSTDSTKSVEPVDALSDLATLSDQSALPDPIDFAATHAATANDNTEPSAQSPRPDASLAVPASITQQYIEKTSQPLETGAIYDTESYHKPLADTGKKKSAAWIILWFVILVVAGAGAGAAFYLFVLPLL